MRLPAPDNRKAILERLISEGIVKKSSSGCYAISNIGALLFAHDLERFGRLGRKALRVILYEGNGRINGIRERQFNKGYAAAFADIMQYINDQLPIREEIQGAFRKEIRAYPEIAIRELLANALIHQDFTLTGCGPMVEIFDHRIEITNPGLPLISPLRFLDELRSRNDGLAKLMRRLNLCEERGSGVDKVVSSIELCQLPPPDFRVKEISTVAVLFSAMKFDTMNREDRIRACYQHASLQWIFGIPMTNASLRKRLDISEESHTTASKIIKATKDAKLIKLHGEGEQKTKASKYVPFWA